MFLVDLWNYIRGYVIIVVTGKSIERFINICSKRQILLWDIIRTGDEAVTIKVSIRGFRLMRPAAKKSGCRVHIEKRCGFPFLFKRLKKRRGFKLGIALFISIMLLSTSIIWDIEISGCKPELVPQVLNVLKMDKIGRGSIKYGLNPKGLASSIIMKIDGIAWVGVEIKGVKLCVNIENSVDSPKLIRNDEFSDIVAKRDGLIKQIEVMAGRLLVKEGETVKKGQLLVSGQLQSQNQEFGTKDVHALARVIARTWYESSLPVSMVYTQRIRTGKTHDSYYLRLFDEKLKLPGGIPPFEHYETSSYDKTVVGPFELKLPIGLTIEKSFEIMERQVDLTMDEALAIAEETAREDLAHRISPDSKVIDEKVNCVKGDNETTYIQVVLECEEDIAGFEP